jgi:hypothetical protein
MTVARWKDEVNSTIFFFVIKINVILYTNWCLVNSKGFIR